jgi:hypothetical protein
MNLYGYANGDPVNYSDPFGLYADRQGEGSSDDENLDAGDPCKKNPDSQACKDHQQIQEMIRQAAQSYCNAARDYGGTVFAGASAEVALLWGLGLAGGVYATSTEFGTYIRVSLFAGFDGSIGGEGGGSVGGFSGVSIGVAGSAGSGTWGWGGGVSVGKTSATATATKAVSVPLAVVGSISYTHTTPMGACPE